MLTKLRLQNTGPAPEMELDLAPRLNLITGDNGLGKSFLLDAAWWALTRRWPHDLNDKLTSGYPARPIDVKKPATISFELDSKTKPVSYTSNYSAADQSWVGRAGRPWNPGLIIYAMSDGGFAVWDPARNYWKTKANADVQERLPAYVFSPKEVWDGLTVDVAGKPTIVCNGLIRDWAGWIREEGGADNLMSLVLKSLRPEGELFVRGYSLARISLDDARDIPTLRTHYSQGIPVLHASSGVRRILGLAYMLLWAWMEHQAAAKLTGQTTASQVVMLIDEIESHLHPQWQRSILSSILDLTQALHSEASIQLIAATHSPLILASAEPFFDAERDAWFDLDLEPKPDVGRTPRVVLRKRPYLRHGDVSNWLTSEAFDLKSARSLEAEQAIEEAKALLRIPAGQTPSRESAKAVHEKLIAARLPDLDPFWVRWRAFVESMGMES